MFNVVWPRLDLLLTVPFTASPTNAMEMNNAMTSSVELEDIGNKRSMVFFLYRHRHNNPFKAKWWPRQQECTLSKTNNYAWKQEVITEVSSLISDFMATQLVIYFTSVWPLFAICHGKKCIPRAVLCIHRLKSFISRLTLNKPPRMRNRLFHKPMQA